MLKDDIKWEYDPLRESKNDRSEIFSLHKNLLEKKVNKEQTIENIVIKTRQYAKRQATWARGKMKNWITVSALDTKLSLKNLFN